MEAGQDLEVRTMHVFISRALQKILKESPKKHTQLRQACMAVLGEEDKEKQRISNEEEREVSLV